MLKNPNTPEDEIITMKRRISQLEDEEDRSHDRIDNTEEIEMLEKELKESKDDLTLTVKEWYEEVFPNDYCSQSLDETTTFADVDDALNNHQDIYEVLGIEDSIIRERIFAKLAEIKSVDYDEVYNKWLEEPESLTEDSEEDFEADEYSDSFENRYKEEPTLYDVDKSVDVLGPERRGAAYPDFNPNYINESEIPDNMRVKWVDTSVDENGDTIYLRWTTQEPFDDEDANIFFDEIKRAYTEVSHNLLNYNKPFRVAVQVTCRDGVEYGDAEADLEIKGE